MLHGLIAGATELFGELITIILENELVQNPSLRRKIIAGQYFVERRDCCVRAALRLYPPLDLKRIAIPIQNAEALSRKAATQVTNSLSDDGHIARDS